VSSQLQAALQYQQQQQIPTHLDYNANPFAAFDPSFGSQFQAHHLNHTMLPPYGEPPQLQANASGGMRNYSSIQDIASDEDDSDQDRF
jgi:hypothetical protein